MGPGVITVPPLLPIFSSNPYNKEDGNSLLSATESLDDIQLLIFLRSVILTQFFKNTDVDVGDSLYPTIVAPD